MEAMTCSPRLRLVKSRQTATLLLVLRYSGELMVQPFPNELWLDIFKGLAEEGELDVLARCSMVCRGFRPMARRWLRHAMAFTNVGEVERIKVDVSGGGLRRLAWASDRGDRRREQQRRAPTSSTSGDVRVETPPCTLR